MTDYTIEDYLAVPYRLVMEAVEGADGEWHRRASYPELPGCTVEGEWAVDVVDALEVLRVEIIERMFNEGRAVLVPRPPLRRSARIDMARLGFTKWLVDHSRLESG